MKYFVALTNKEYFEISEKTYNNVKSTLIGAPVTRVLLVDSVGSLKDNKKVTIPLKNILYVYTEEKAEVVTNTQKEVKVVETKVTTPVPKPINKQTPKQAPKDKIETKNEAKTAEVLEELFSGK